ncbi:MAG: hypothetical protein AABW59_02995 [archaeon]
MPILRKRVNRAIARKASANEAFNKEFDRLNPNYKGHEEEAYAKQWMSRSPSKKIIYESINASNAYERAMKIRTRREKLRMSLNPKAAERLKKMRATQSKTAKKKTFLQFN